MVGADDEVTKRLLQSPHHRLQVAGKVLRKIEEPAGEAIPFLQSRNRGVVIIVFPETQGEGLHIGGGPGKTPE